MSKTACKEDIYDQYKDELTTSVMQTMHEYDELTDSAFREMIAEVIRKNPTTKTLSLDQKRSIATKLFNRMRRLDILQPLMDDPGITEIMVNGPKKVFYEREGQLFSSDLQFEDEATLTQLMLHFFSGANRPLNEASPISDLRLPDGSRANAVLAPIAPDGPIFTIRKFTGVRPDMKTLISTGFICEEAALYLEKAVIHKKTIFLCGGTGSGKTTFLNTLSGFIPKNERVVTIEDSAELSLQGITNLVRLEARLPGPDGQGGIHIGQLIRTALRMRPDRIVVGEVRGSEAADMLHALHTGHPGSLCTGHANSCMEMLERLSTMVLEGSHLPFDAVIRQINMGVDILVHITRGNDGKRFVDEIVRMLPLEDNHFRIETIYSCRKEVYQ
ncbi:MAG TPA: ATPase, T2SS/T4P/T4SS family [Bacillota bacterium]|nr:ATPase, T2SS/T4P/T4SS family [Bacillota bacterium]HPE38457.1 ATPase, T2SS/T4P/T4SS family [Bacillota bacterium]